jgi:hypothetical protein
MPLIIMPQLPQMAMRHDQRKVSEPSKFVLDVLHALQHRHVVGEGDLEDLQMRLAVLSGW